MKFIGATHKFGSNINTDGIIPARYCMTIDYKELALHCMEDVDDTFRKRVKPGDIIIAGNNFGCGSSREVAPIAIKHAGISCVIAQSFARIFYRNSFNIGLPLIEIPDIIEKVDQGDQLEVDIGQCNVFNKTRNIKLNFKQELSILKDIIEVGGIINYIK